MKSVGIITLIPFPIQDNLNRHPATTIEGIVMNQTQGIEKTMYGLSIISALSGKDVIIAWLVAAIVVTSFALAA